MDILKHFEHDQNVASKYVRILFKESDLHATKKALKAQRDFKGVKEATDESSRVI